MNNAVIIKALRVILEALESESTAPAAPALPEREVLTTEQAAEVLGLHPKVVLRFVSTKGLPGQKVGRVWRFRRSQLMDWLTQQGRAA